jgi:DNA adenine methylase
VKWPGSKRAVAASLHRMWPGGMRRFVDPFVGGGSMLVGRPGQAALAGDVQPELIALWRVLQRSPDEAVRHYRAHWEARVRRGGVVFDEVRERYNAGRDPLDLLFLSRTCVNGLIRFNRQGSFNNSLHHTRPGIHPDRFEGVVGQWRAVLAGVELVCADFEQTLASAGPCDAVFLDPPYRGTRGRYLQGTFGPERLLATLEDLNTRAVPWLLTWDGEAGERRYSPGVPAELYRCRLPLGTGSSPFPRVQGGRVDQVVESVYLGWSMPGPIGMAPSKA